MRICAIAINTLKEGVRQPVFYLMVGGGAVLILLSVYFTLFSFGEEAKLLKDMGLATIALFGLIIALFTSSSVIADEIEKKTVLTVLCKPVSRSQFVLGKFLGIVSAALVAMLTLALVLCLALYLHEKTGSIHAHSMSRDDSQVLAQVSSVFVGAIFAFLQVFVITAISVAISTRFPMIVNVSVCLSLYILGHVTRYLFAHAPRGALAGYLATAVYAQRCRGHCPRPAHTGVIRRPVGALCSLLRRGRVGDRPRLFRDAGSDVA